jgi:hypothetical protein
MNTAERDLARKLVEDVDRAILRYVDLCETIDQPPTDQLTIILSELMYTAIGIAQRVKVPKESFLACTERAWDRCMKEGKKHGW